jgi:primosomal protein N' (replication factor Y) (superfamily II helicase)
MVDLSNLSLFNDGADTASLADRARVVLPLPVAEPFDYAVPAGMVLGAGDHVMVPLGPRLVQGVVWGIEKSAAVGNLKPVERRLDIAPLPDASRRFFDWMSAYICAPIGQVVRLGLRGASPDPLPQTSVLHLTGRLPDRASAARTSVMGALRESPVKCSQADLAKAAGCSPGVVRGLIDAGVIAVSFRPVFTPPEAPDLLRDGLSLRPAQREALDAIRAHAMEGGSEPLLINGVTGSGKTEVFLEALRDVLLCDERAQVLILVPEIALTDALLNRVTERFGAAPLAWHSGIGPGARRAAFQFVADGRARIVVGARSALFLPFAHLKAIVIDEEHDGSYKQDEGLCYHARDLAVVRAKHCDARLYLASATPSLETIANVRRGRYREVVMSARAGSAGMPEVSLINLVQEPPERDHWLSQPLVRAICENWAAGDQTLLYLNRRGYAPLVICRACGHRMKAPDSDSWLVEHRYSGMLICHRTGFTMRKPKACPKCQAEDKLHAVGPGVERLHEEVRARFPDARTAIFSSDTAPDAERVLHLVGAMERREIDILIGTQIVAKGHNFPHLTLVGVVDADLALRGGDLRAAERTAQVAIQVTGRAGRADKPGRALIQTSMPDHPALAALARRDLAGFVEAELADREATGMPPFGRLALFNFSGRQLPVLEEVTRLAGRVAPQAVRVEVLGPSDPHIAVLRGQWRKRFLVRAPLDFDLSAFMRDWRAALKVPASVRAGIDIDPYNFA